MVTRKVYFPHYGITATIKDKANLSDAHYTEPQKILCKWCDSDDIAKYGIDKGTQEYICNKCHRKFNLNDNPFGKRSSLKILELA